MPKFKYKKPPACSPQILPIFTREDFPQLTKDPLNYMKEPFKRYLVMKQKDPSIKMSSLSLFEVNKELKSVVGKKHSLEGKVTTLRSGLLLIEVDQKPIYDKLMKTTKLRTIEVVIEEHSGLNSSKGVIYCDNEAVKKMTNDEIKAELVDQGVTDVYRIIRRNGNESEPSNNFIITFNKTSPPKEMKMGYLNVEVKLYIPHPRRCFNCQRYGHGKNTCTHEPVCPTCGKAGHEYGSDECDKIKSCYHCEQEHATTSRDCPMYKLEKEIMEVKYKSNVNFKQARSIVYSQNPQLTAQISSIKTTTPKASYSKVSAQTNNLEKRLFNLEGQLSLLTQRLGQLLNVNQQPQSSKQSQSMPQSQQPHSSKTFIPQSDSDSEMEITMPDIETVRRFKVIKRRLNHNVSSSSEDENSQTEPPTKQSAPPSRQGDSNMSAPPTPSEEEASSNRQEEVNMPAPPHPVDLRVSKGGGEAPPHHQEDQNSGKSTPGDGDGFVVVGNKKTTKNSSPSGGAGRDASSGNSRQTPKPASSSSSGQKEGVKTGSSVSNKEQRSAVSNQNKLKQDKANVNKPRPWKK